jgi:N-acetylmuramoyl-L-alanine amidase/putative methionine-R-sulfoxide reductase with GAF domain
MATSTTKPDIQLSNAVGGICVPEWPRPDGVPTGVSSAHSGDPHKPTQLNALQALLAFSALHDQIRRRKALSARHNGFDSPSPASEFEPEEQFVLDEVLQLVAERGVAITGADGLAIALAENNEIVLRASSGMVRPDVGARIDRDSAFSGACFRTAQVVVCDDTEVDNRVNVGACRKLGARSMVAVPLCGRKRVIGLLEAFSSWPFSFNDSDVRNLTLLAELIVAALRPEDEDRFAESAQVAAVKLESPKLAVPAAPASDPSPIATPAAPIAVSAPEALNVTPVGVVAPAKPVDQSVLTSTPTLPAKPVAQTIPATFPASSAKPVQPSPLASTPAVLAKPLAPPVSLAASPAKPEIKPLESPSIAKSEAKPAALSPLALAAIAAAAPTVEPKLTFGQVATESRRPWPLIALVSIVVLSAFGAGAWWKIKTAQIGSAMVQSGHGPAKAADQNAQSSAADVAASATPSISDGASPGNSPAAPQELSKFPHVTGVRHWSSSDSSTVVLDLEDQVQYEPGHLANPDRYYFDLRDTQLTPELEGKSFDGDTLLSRIRIAQPLPGMTRVVLEARPTTTLSRPQVSLERDPYRLVIQVSKAGVTPKGAVNLFPNAPEVEKNKLAIVVPPPTREDLQLRARAPKLRIVVDAGHGGWDLGTVGRRGLLEKDLVLEIAERLGKLLESRLGSTVIYTRQDDNYIPLDDRAEIANQAQADLFVSVHANYSDLPSARGVETYYSNFFSAPGSKEANSTNPKDPALKTVANSNSDSTLTPGDLHERIEQSRRLAASVQRSLYGTLSVQNPGLRDRGIKEAGFVVLTESAMPGILAEVSFVSSPADEQKLRSDGYREQIAEALYRGIARYAASSKGVKIASAAK